MMVPPASSWDASFVATMEAQGCFFVRHVRTLTGMVRQSAYWGAFLTLTYELPTGYPGISFRSGSNSVAFTVTSPDLP